MIKILAVLLLLVSCGNKTEDTRYLISHSCQIGAMRMHKDLGPAHGRMIDLEKHLDFCKDLAKRATGEE